MTLNHYRQDLDDSVAASRINFRSEHIFKASHLKNEKGDTARPRGGLSKYPDMQFEFGSLCEWGMPQGGRELLLEFMSSRFEESLSHDYWSLWINTHAERSIYPPAWDAQGVDLRRIRFADSKKPLQELRPVFSECFFKIIVIDASRGSLTDEDCAYLLRQARKNRYLVFIVRDYFLSTKSSLVWAKCRFNVIVDHVNRFFRIKPLRGRLHQNLLLSSRKNESELCL